jgi:protoheme IX farnesyltransferase
VELIAAEATPTRVVLEVGPERVPVRERSRLGAFIEITKPGITRLVLVTTAAGFYLAGRGSFDLVLFLNTLIGVALAASGAGALNQYVERDADARMRRTAKRPLPSGRLTEGEALGFAVGLSVAGLAWLLLLVDPLTTALVGASLLSYIALYTPLKKRTWLNTVVGAVPGALPILAGWTAGGGGLDARGIALFAILFVWQMPHFFALAWIYREDYVRGGFRMLTAADPAGARTARQIVMYTALLLPVSLLPTVFGVAGRFYLIGAVALGAMFFALGAALVARRTERRAWRLFMGSVVYLPVLLILRVLDKVAA